MYENNIYSSENADSGTVSRYRDPYRADNAYSSEDRRYQHYQTHQTGGYGSEAGLGAVGDPADGRKPKKKGGYLRKLAASVTLGLCFGLCAGASSYAIWRIGNFLNQDSPDVLEIEGEAVRTSGTGETQSGIRLADTGSVQVVTSDVSEMVKEVMPAMVSIISNYTQTGMTVFGQTYSQEAATTGSGIIVAQSDTELLIVTNNHVVSDSSGLQVAFLDGTTADAQVKGTDADMDLAVLSIPLASLSEETKDSIVIALLGDSDSLELGEPVVVIGNALGYGLSVTGGYVSALNREVSLEDGSTGTFIQTDAAINPGNSGGALLDVNGMVIGIPSNKIGGSVVEGMGYAIPISAAKPIIEDLMSKETRNKVAEVGYVGISNPQDITSQIAARYNMPIGLYITTVEADSPAQRAGLLQGDIVVKFDGESIKAFADLQKVLEYYGPGTTVSLTVMRPGNGEYQERELTLTLGRRPDAQR
ncbi:MAG: trypsin-like peptidase domain-containing protein [Clostridium sp.]|jgi:serine protease Do|nr:trypsin-like peptidase domain-containing protein [Clostridium sp.]